MQTKVITTGNVETINHSKILVANPFHDENPIVKKILKQCRFHARYTLRRELIDSGFRAASPSEQFNALGFAVRDAIFPLWGKSNELLNQPGTKIAYYLSLEFMIGRLLGNSLLNMNLLDSVTKALKRYHIDINELENQEPDPGEGNGGLGRLAACFMTSLASLRIPAIGYGLLYDFGIFKQAFMNERQIEIPDKWLSRTYPFTAPYENDAVFVQFGGRIQRPVYSGSENQSNWVDTRKIRLVPWDIPIVGYDKSGLSFVNTLRLWKASEHQNAELDLESFGKDNYYDAFRTATTQEAATINAVLYPKDHSDDGKRIRLKQQYCLVSASLQDIMARFIQTEKRGKKEVDWTQFPKAAAIQINDTHPSLIIPELMRVLVDEKELSWDQAWKITKQTVSYTNHTILPEAMEQWKDHFLADLLPRHLQIIETINERYISNVRNHNIHDASTLENMSIISNGYGKTINMAKLAIVGSHHTNGVAKLHGEILKADTFRNYNEYNTLMGQPNAIDSITNGVDPRRWLDHVNPLLSALITEKIGDGWLTNFEEIREFEKFGNDEQVKNRLVEIKFHNKAERFNQKINELAVSQGHLAEITNKKITINPQSIVFSMCKRIHPYKRQDMMALGILDLYNQLKMNPRAQNHAKTFLFAGKAAFGFHVAQDIIHLINIMSNKINNDTEINNKLSVHFLPNYNVSQASIIIPATDVSVQISTAGYEASGTGNMKFAMNGALTMGTMDGANVEMAEEIGQQWMQIFGLNTQEINESKRSGYNPKNQFYNSNDFPEIRFLINQLWGVIDRSHLSKLIQNDDELLERYFHKEKGKPLGNNLEFSGPTTEIIGRIRRDNIDPIKKSLLIKNIDDQFLSSKPVSQCTQDEVNYELSTLQRIGDRLINGQYPDEYRVLLDFYALRDAISQVDSRYSDQESWKTMMLLNTARMGYFSSDRSIMEYATRIWDIAPIPR